MIIRVATAVTLVTYVFVGLRLVSRCMVSKLWWDDWLMIASAVSTAGSRKLLMGCVLIEEGYFTPNGYHCII